MNKTKRSMLATLMAVVMTASFAAVAFATDLSDAHENTPWDASGFECDPSDLDMIEPGQVLWHFVLTQPESDSGNIWAEFENEGSVGPIANTVKGQGGGSLQFYIITGLPDTLIDAETDVAGNNLVLSHICYKEIPTPTPTPTPTPEDTPTPTPEDTPTPTPTDTPPDTAVVMPSSDQGSGGTLVVLIAGLLAAGWLFLRPLSLVPAIERSRGRR